MKLWQFSITLILSLVCLCLILSTLGYVRSARQLQGKIQDEQGVLNRVRQEQLIARSIIEDLTTIAPHNTRVMMFLQGHNINVPPPTVQNPAPNAVPAKTQKKTMRK